MAEGRHVGRRVHLLVDVRIAPREKWKVELPTDAHDRLRLAVGDELRADVGEGLVEGARRDVVHAAAGMRAVAAVAVDGGGALTHGERLCPDEPFAHARELAQIVAGARLHRVVDTAGAVPPAARRRIIAERRERLERAAQHGFRVQVVQAAVGIVAGVAGVGSKQRRRRSGPRHRLRNRASAVEQKAAEGPRHRSSGHCSSSCHRRTCASSAFHRCSARFRDPSKADKVETAAATGVSAACEC